MPVIALPRIRVWISCNKKVSVSIVFENGGEPTYVPVITQIKRRNSYISEPTDLHRYSSPAN